MLPNVSFNRITEYSPMSEDWRNSFGSFVDCPVLDKHAYKPTCQELRVLNNARVSYSVLHSQCEAHLVGPKQVIKLIKEGKTLFQAIYALK